MRPVSLETKSASAPPERVTQTLLQVRWLTRAAWGVALPLVAGPALVHGWSDAATSTRTTAFVVAWAGWLVGLTGVVWARTVGYTTLRVLAPIVAASGGVGAVWGVTQSDPVGIGGSVAAMVVALALLTPVVLQAQLDAASYGSELRFSLKTPPVLYLGPLPLAWLCIALGTIVGPLLIASGKRAGGIIGLVVGVPLALLAIRSVHTLSARWLVLVPAGVVVRDPMVLTDPILIPRDHIAGITPAAGAPPDGAIDLRLGAVVRSVAVRCTEPTEGMRIRKGRAGTIAVDGDLFFVAPARPRAFLAEFERRGRR